MHPRGPIDVDCVLDGAIPSATAERSYLEKQGRGSTSMAASDTAAHARTSESHHTTLRGNVARLFTIVASDAAVDQRGLAQQAFSALATD